MMKELDPEHAILLDSNARPLTLHFSSSSTLYASAVEEHTHYTLAVIIDEILILSSSSTVGCGVK